MKSKMFLGFLFILTGSVVEAVLGDQCQQQNCPEVCCDNGDDCCERDSFWNWYVIIGIVVAGIFGFIFAVGIVILLCTYCAKAKQSHGTTGRVVSNNRVHPAEAPPPYMDRSGNPMPPSYSAYEPPPKYESLQLTPQTRSTIVPQPRTSAGIPRRTNSRTINHT